VTFSDELRTAAAKTWDAVATHRFVDELWAGRLEPGAFGAHLVQEHLVLDPVVALMGATVAACDLPESRLAHARRLGLLAGPPTAYLARAMDVLDVPMEERTHPEAVPATAELHGLLDATRLAGDHPSCLAVLLVTDWLRLDCATRPDAEPPIDPLTASGWSCGGGRRSRAGSRSCAWSSTGSARRWTRTAATRCARSSSGRPSWSWRSSTARTPESTVQTCGVFRTAAKRAPWGVRHLSPLPGATRAGNKRTLVSVP
jgi:thiaminase/transcriptional activator TenA